MNKINSVSFRKIFFLFTILFAVCSTRANAGFAEYPLSPSDTTFTINIVGNTSFCPGGSVKLDVTSNMNFPSDITFQWKNPSDIIGAVNYEYIANSTGNYSVTVTRGIGRDTTLTGVSVTQLLNPIANFTFSQSTTCAGVPVFFKDNSSGIISTYTWDFGDGQASNISNPIHLYSSFFGNSNVNFITKLTVTNTSGCSNSISKSITISQRPEAKILGTSIICTGASQSIFSFNNGSSTSASNTDYLFIWGDGSPNTDIALFNSAQSHQYLKGNSNLLYIVTGDNSCKDTLSKVIYLGSNPSAGIASPGNTNICSNSSLTFPISSFENNSPGTNYLISFNDGSPSLAFNQSNIPTSVTHTYTSGSCGIISNSITNSFYARIEATNPCATTVGTVTPIYVSEKPVANFSISKDTNCVNLATTFKNTSLGYKTVSTNGDCLQGNKVWKITPATGFTLGNGQTLGDTFNDSDPLNWLNSSTDNLIVTFTTPGTYIIRLTIGGSSTCPPSFIEKTVCINPVPVASFTLDNNTGCLPLTINANNIVTAPNCGLNTYTWSTSYTPTLGCLPNTSLVSYTGGTNATSINPQFLFGNPGAYKVNLVVTSPAAACTSPVYSLPVVIKSKPTVAPITASASICVNNSITPITTVGNCNSSTVETYAWLFPGGSIISSTNSAPGSITYTSTGTSTISLDVTNECGTTTVTKSLTVSALPNAPTGIDNARCGTGTVALSATAAAGETIDWYSAAIGGTLLKSSSNSFTTTNISSTTIYYAESKNASGCVSLSRTPVTATINPIPVTPTVGSNSSICAGSTLNLTATLVSGVTYSWSGPNGFSSNVQYPSITNATIAATGTYTLITKLNTCNSPASSTNVTVKAIPATPTASSNSAVCVGNTISLSASTINSATYAWVGPNSFVSTLQNPTIPNATAAANGTYSVIATVNGCSNTAANTSVIINSLPTLIITNPATFCVSSSVDLTNSNITNGSSAGLVYTYWNNALASSQIISPTAVSTAGTYYIKAVNANSCYVISPVLVTTTPLPTSYSVTGGGAYCSGGVGVPVNLNGSQNGINYQLFVGAVPVGSPVLGTGSGLNFGSQTTAGTYTVVATNAVTNCNSNMGNSVSVAINPLLSPTINITASANPICKGSTVTFTSAITNGGLSPIYQWQKNGTTVGSNSTSYSDASLINGDIITCILTASGCSSASTVTSNAVTVTVNDIPTITSVTPNSNCGSGTILLAATNSAGTINWFTTISGGVSINTGSSFTTPTLATSKTYYVDATSNNCTTASRTPVTATINALPQASVIADKTICFGNAIQIGAQSVVGNTYAWSSNHSGYTNTSSNPSVSPSVNTVYSLTETVTATGCNRTNGVTITVNPIPDVSVSTLNQTICSNTLTSIDLSSTIVGTVFNWTVSNNASITGAIAGTGVSIAQKLINSSTAAQSVTYSVTPSLTNNLVTCSAIATNIVITVNPSASIQFSRLNETICSGSNSSPVLLTSTSSNVIFNWTSLQPVGITGVITSGTNTIPSQLLVNSSNRPITIQYATSTRTNDINSCQGIDASYAIIVNPVPDVIATPSSQTLCSNNATNILLSTTVTGTTFDWTIGINSNISGASSGSGSSIKQTLINNSAIPQIVQYSITPKFLNAGISCSGTTITVSITVNPSPQLLGSLIQTSTCTNKLFSYNPSSNTPGTTFTWTRSAVTGIVNPAVLNGTDGISENLINSTQAPIKVSYNYTLSANGCSNNQVITDTIFPNAKSLFVVDKLISCAPFKLSDHITVTRFPLANDEFQYIWLANNIQIGTGLQIPSYIISNTSDTVKLSLIANSKYGCNTDTMTQTIYTIEQSVPGFTVSSHKACGPVSISFVNTTIPINVLNNSSYLWDFGNGKTSTNINPTAQIYNAALSLKDTTYYIMLSVTTQCKTLNYIDSILIRPSAKALFTPSATVGCSPFNVTFRNNSLGANNLGNGMVYHWSFGDGSYDTTTNLNSVSHIYHNGSQKIDTVIVKLYATNECGTDSIQYNIVVFPNTVKPALIINGNERFSCAPLTVHFFNNSTGATRFNWNFGDGTVYSSTKASDTVIHVFNTSGTFIITLNATNGCSDTTIRDSVVVYPSINFPDFSIIKPISCLVDSVQFKNNTDTSKMNSFVWNLGDGTTSNSFEMTHQYKQAGIFNVSLFASKTYTTGVTCSATITKTVQILNNPTAIFTSNDNVLNCSPFNYIVNTTPSLAGSAEWLFSDPYSVDTVAIGFNASHLFSKAGTYRIRLKVSNQSGCSDSAIQNVVVTESPIANIDYTDSIICTKNGNTKTILFKNASTYSGQNLIKYEWWIGGVLISTSSTSLTHTFTANSTDILPKIFNVTLKAISSIGCSTSQTVPISFVPYPKASIIVSKSASCGNAIINASDNEMKVPHFRKWTCTSNNPSAPLIVISNDTSSNITLSIPINNSKTIIDYNLILNVVSGGACADSMVQQIRIYPQPLVDFIIKDTLCSNVDYNVTNLSDPFAGGNSSNMGFAWFVKKYMNYGDTLITNYLTDIHPTINLSNSGIKDSVYFINLIGTSPFGCIDSSMHKIIVHPSTFARFTSSPSISCTPLTLFVQSNTSVNAASYAWYINNIFYSDSKIPNDTVLTKSGIRYNLKLVANSSFGCLSDSLISVITTYTAPISKFNVSQASSCSGALQVSFYNGSVASGTTINTWFWDFGDGTTSTIPNPVHQYNLPGSYNVSLNVQDGRGCFSDSATVKTIIIYGKPTANYLSDNVCLGDSVRFINLSQLGFGSTQFDKVFWNFGDGTNSSVFSPSHLYNGPGTYTITLTVLSDKSCIADTIIKKVTVFGKPKADFSWDISCVNMPINFTDLSVPGFGEVALSNTKWDFGNGLTSNLFSPRIQYSSTGIYQISLKVYNAICSNLADTIYKQISIYEARQGVRYPRVEAVYGNPQPLHALAGGISYNWSPATGLDYSNIKDPIALYDNRVANKIDYSILIKDSAGCIINDQQEVFIFLKPAIWAPTAFIVDGSDPLNRRFLPHYINISRLVNFRILDRWGVEQFSTADMSKYWDGNDRKGNPLPMETYIWIAVGVDNNGNQVIGKGNITLVRNGNK